jgi:hypothetical protein
MHTRELLNTQKWVCFPSFFHFSSLTILTGVKLLQAKEDQAWRDYHDLSYRLYKIHAQLLHLAKKHKEAENHCEYFFPHTITKKEKMEVYLIQHDAIEAMVWEIH